MTTIKQIEELLPYLLVRDSLKAKTSLAIRDFENIRELVESTIHKIEEANSTLTPKESLNKYLLLDIDKLELLLLRVQDYILQINAVENNEDNDTGEWLDENNANYLE